MHYFFRRTPFIFVNKQKLSLPKENISHIFSRYQKASVQFLQRSTKELNKKQTNKQKFHRFSCLHKRADMHERHWRTQTFRNRSLPLRYAFSLPIQTLLILSSVFIYCPSTKRKAQEQFYSTVSGTGQFWARPASVGLGRKEVGKDIRCIT